MKKRQLTSAPLTDQFTLSRREKVEGLKVTASEIEGKAVGSIVLPLQIEHMFDHCSPNVRCPTAI